MARQKFGIEVHGAKELARALKKVDPELAAELKGVNLDLARLVASTALDRVPVRGGDLKRSIRAGATLKSGVVRAGKKLVPYAGPIHFGVPRQKSYDTDRGIATLGPIKPNPFLYDALDARRDEVGKAYLKAVNTVVDKANHTRTVRTT